MTAVQDPVDREVDILDLSAVALEAEPVTPRRPGVLVALGDPQSRMDLALLLACEGFDVWTAGSGVEAITSYLEHAGSVDVLLIDAELPDLSGPAFIRRFKTHFPGVPCVFRAGSSDVVSRQLAIAGVCVVPRTITPSMLVDRLREEIAFKEWMNA
ncbi:MAG TPA: response regulator [Gemmataceae bacterium]|nr:response regulator [Gemmataceae bacterium]